MPTASAVIINPDNNYTIAFPNTIYHPLKQEHLSMYVPPETPPKISYHLKNQNHLSAYWFKIALLTLCNILLLVYINNSNL